ncbi:hypothetical protein HRI_003488300 [Hibiscus trionum]|uniref:Uncharacterized protein n=1 Tax=Hibiscus trionum TaxID=183268 RepID=A0A9W7IL93_HIBTR|nr:hypothetical protein HRI_003488300 [Hibiscus trionum]
MKLILIASPYNCFPCIPSTASSLERKRSFNPGTLISKKKAPLKLSFKWREGHVTPTLDSPVPYYNLSK